MKTKCLKATAPLRPIDISALTFAITLSLNAPLVLAAPVEFHIPAQELDKALDAFKAQAKVELLYSPSEVRNLEAASLEGAFEPAEALARLIVNAKLIIERTESGGYRLAPVRKETTNTNGINKIVVAATRTEQRITDVPAAVSVITSADIAQQQVTRISDAVQNVEGVDVIRSATLGSSETVTIRGVGGSFAGSTSQVLLDGIPLESPVTGIHVGIKALSIDDVDRIEVVRGPSSALYGPSAVGGVVNLVSKRWEREAGADVRLAIGSHNTRTTSAAVGGMWESFDFRLSASDYSTDGFKAQPEPDIWGSKDLDNRDAKQRQYGFAGAWRPSNHQEVTFGVRDTEVESAWLGGHPNYRLDNAVESYDVGYRHEIGDQAVIKLNYRKLRQEVEAKFDEEYISGVPGSLILEEVDRRVDDSDYVELQADVRLNADNLLTVGYVYSLSDYTSRWEDVLYGDSGVRISKSRLNGIFVQDEHRFGERLTLFAGGRYDSYEFFDDSVDGVETGEDSEDSVFNPRVSALFQLTETTGLYATAGTAYVPALNTLKFRESAAWLDNPALDPEKSVTYELGLHYASRAWLGRVSIFHTDYTDKIASNRVGPQWQFQNIGEVKVQGIELALEGASGHWRPYLNYAYTDSTIEKNPSDPSTEGKRLQRVSPNKLNLGVTYTPSEGYFARLGGRYVDEFYYDDRNTPDARNPGYFVADLKIGAQLPVGGPLRKLELTAAVNNLLDREYGEEQFEVADERNYWIGVNGSF